MHARWLPVAMAVLLGGLQPAAADCPAPSLSADRHVAPGETLSVGGDAFGPCEDVGGACSNVGVAAPASVHLSVTGEDGEIAADDVAPDDQGRFRAELLLPHDAAPGEYEILATPSDSSHPTATTRIVVK